MTPTELRQAIADLGYTQRALAARMGINERRIHAWLAGERRVPWLMPVVLKLIREMETERRDDMDKAGRYR